MTNAKRLLTYRQKIALSFLLLVLIPVTLSGYLLVRYTLDRNREQLREGARQTTRAAVDQLSSRLSVALNRLSIVEDNALLQQYLDSKQNSLADLVEMQYYLRGLQTTYDMGLNAREIPLRVYRYLSGPFPASFVEPVTALPTDMLMRIEALGDGETLTQFLKGEDALRLYRVDRRLNGTPRAVVQVTVPIDLFRDALSASYAHQERYAALIGQGGAAFPLTYLPADFSPAAQERGFLHLWYDLAWSGKLLRLVSAPDGGRDQSTIQLGAFCFGVPDSQIYEGIPALAAFLFFYMLLTSLAILSMSRLMTRKLDAVVEQIRLDYGQGKPSSAQSDAPGDEFAMISGKISEMLTEIHLRGEMERRMQLEKKELETQLLQELINPHFLYNALDGIKWGCKSERTAQVVDALVDYYRLSLNKGKLFVTVDEELLIVREYLKIQQFAYEADFIIEEEVDGDMDGLYIMKHTLQPFVENALLHGIDKSAPDSVIGVRAERVGGQLHLTIRDNGCGADPARIRLALSGQGREGKGGYGMLNVKKRLENIYGGDYSLEVDSQMNLGTKVTLRIPILTKEDIELRGASQ